MQSKQESAAERVSGAGAVEPNVAVAESKSGAAEEKVSDAAEEKVNDAAEEKVSDAAEEKVSGAAEELTVAEATVVEAEAETTSTEAEMTMAEAEATVAEAEATEVEDEDAVAASDEAVNSEKDETGNSATGETGISAKDEAATAQSEGQPISSSNPAGENKADTSDRHSVMRKACNSFCGRNGIDEKDRDQLITTLQSIADELTGSTVSDETLQKLARALSYERDIAQAEIQGRNTRIEQLLAQQQSTSQIHQLAMTSPAPSRPAPPYSRIGGLSAADRQTIWERGKEKRVRH